MIMAGRTVAAHLDGASADRLGKIAAAEGRNPSQLVAIATRLLVDMSPAARRAFIALDGSKPEERDFAARIVGRAALKARERVIASRVDVEYSPVTNNVLDTEEAIDRESVAATRR
jgi:hypothetical protein